jgi:hypothetical protein
MWAGYGSKKAMAYGVSLAVMMAAEHYDPVLCTSPEKWKRFFKPLDLPFEDVHLTDFSSFKGPDRWRNTAKFYAMRHFGPPFVYLDNHVFLRGPVPDFGRMLFMHPQPFARDRHAIYRTPVYAIEEHRQSFRAPPVWDGLVRVGYRTGVVGCKDKEWMDEWVETGLDWVRTPEVKEMAQWFKMCNFPVVFDRHLAACVDQKIGGAEMMAGDLAEFEDRTTGRVSSISNDDEGTIGEHIATQSDGDIHLSSFTGQFKQTETQRRRVVQTLSEEYPQTYAQVQSQA